MLREVLYMESHIIYLEELNDSCSTRLDKARAAIGLKQTEIDNLDFIDSQNMLIVSEQQRAIYDLRDAYAIEQKKTKFWKGTTWGAVGAIPVAIVFGLLMSKNVQLGN